MVTFCTIPPAPTTPLRDRLKGSRGTESHRRKSWPGASNSLRKTHPEFSASFLTSPGQTMAIFFLVVLYLRPEGQPAAAQGPAAPAPGEKVAQRTPSVSGPLLQETPPTLQGQASLLGSEAL